jgi:hypothetical protein
MTKTAIAVFASLLFAVSTRAQTPNLPNLPALAKIKTSALVVRATTSISCGDGSEGTCVRQDPDILAKVTNIVSGTDLWTHVDKMDATQADAILDFEVKDATTTYGRISFSVRDADNNNFLYFETRDVVVIENDVTRIVSHFLQVVEDAKKAAHRKEAPEKS